MSHRTIDVDVFDADQYVEDEVRTEEDTALHTNITAAKVRPPAALDAAVKAAANDVRALMSRGQVGEALQRALQDAPVGRDDQAAKDANLKTVMDVLGAVKTADVLNIVKMLSSDEIDLLMKYIYRGMSLPERFQSATLLQWHEKVCETGGLGCIVRVMTDMKSTV